MKNRFKIKNLPCSQKSSDSVCKSYVDNLFNVFSIIKNTSHLVLIDRNITNARFIQVNQLPQIDSHLTAKLFVDIAIDESSVNRNNQDNDFNNYNLTNTNSNTLTKPAEKDNDVITKAYVDQFHQKKERSRQDLGIGFYVESSDLVKNNQDNDLIDNKLTNVDSISVNRNPNSNNELVNKKHLDDELDKNTVLILNQTIQSYLKVTVGNDTYNLTKNSKTQLTDTTFSKTVITGGYLLPYWKTICNDKNFNVKYKIL